MVNILDSLVFENPEILALAIGVIIFIVAYTVINILFKDNKGITIVISLCISAIASWNIYINRFYSMERMLAIFVSLAVLGLFLKIMYSFLKFGKKSF